MKLYIDKIYIIMLIYSYREGDVYMNVFSSWLFYVILYLFFSVAFNQYYKITTKTMVKPGSLTVLMQLMAGAFCLFLVPFFKIEFPQDIKVYLFLGIAIIFYALDDRMGTTVRSGLEASTCNVIKQLSTAFMIIFGLIFFKEPFILNKVIGAFLIVISNILVFFDRKSFKLNKYVYLGIIANLCFTVALFIDVNLSEQFNLPFYVALTLMIPALLIFVFERLKPKDIFLEFKNGNKKTIIKTSFCWSIMLFSQLMAYQLGKATIVAPLCSLTVILNVIIGYSLLQEKDNLFKKIIASILIIISVILIKV